MTDKKSNLLLSSLDVLLLFSLLNATKMFHFKQTLLPDSSKDKRIFARPKHVEHKTSKKICRLLYVSEGLTL